MDKTYDPNAIEQQCYTQWEQAGYFQPNGQTDTESYCVLLPPPNITGYLHMGHGFQQTLMDCLVRYHRMLGHNTLWQGGVDHAGIATQMVVERQLQQEQQKTRHDLGRAPFIEKIWQWKATSGDRINQQIRRLGASIDWTRTRFTMDDNLSKAVNKVFIELYDQGLIYRGKRLVNWDPKLHTAISDLEVINEEEVGSLWYINYPVVGETTIALTIATTRPETLLGDSAVAVHPDDKRYQHLIGKSIQLPLTDRTIPIIADTYVDPSFGTGCVKITPAHDFNDYAVGLRHNLAMINILTADAAINSNAPEAYIGLDRFAARKQIIADLDKLNLLVKTEAHTHKIPRGDRSGVIIEPYLTDQWYVKMEPLAEPAIQAVKTGQVKFIPENWDKTYFQWLENIEDWCISRQLWWGHRIPAWYDTDNNIYVGASETAVREKYQLDNTIILTQDDDVLDTWFSSALWPFSTLGWPEQTIDLSQFYPSNVLVTGFDIIFFWVARMIMLGLKFMQQIPFDTVYITGLIRDADGQKMSKSKGNVLDPIDLIDGIALDDLVHKRTQAMMQPQLAQKIEQQTRKNFPDGLPAAGCDALRFTFCALAANTRNIRFDINRLTGYRNFCNKLWNAARFVLMHIEQQQIIPLSTPDQEHLVNRWIHTRLQQVINQAHGYFAQYRFDLLAQLLYEFVWNDYCDWYLELTKPILQQDNQDAQNNHIQTNNNINTIKANTRYRLVSVLETITRLLHPLIPFITETIWQQLRTPLNLDQASIMLAAYPAKTNSSDLSIDQAAIDSIEWLKAVIISIRTIRAEMNISPAKTVPIYLRKGTIQDKTYLVETQPLLMHLAKLSQLEWLDSTADTPAAATGLVGELELLIPMADLINKSAELARLKKALDKLTKEITRLSNKLANQNFIAKAPETVVQQERTKLAELLQQYEKLKEQQVKISEL